VKVLIVDDSKTMRSIHRSVIGKIGNAEIEEACDGQDALSKASAFQPDLILLDRNMPNMDGYTFLKIYRSKGNSTPIIMITSEACKTSIVDAIKAGVNDYVVKPFSPEKLSERIKKILEKQQAA